MSEKTDQPGSGRVKMKYTIVIPARYGSSRFPGKPLARLQGKTIISWVVMRARSCPGARVVVASDHKGIADEARAAGAEVVMTRPDHRSGTDRVAEAVRLLDPPGGPNAVIVNLQGDEPLIEPDSVAAVLQPFEDAGLRMATVAAPLLADEASASDVVKVVVDAAGRALYFSRSVIPWSHSPQNGHRHIGLYAYRRRVLQHLSSLPSCALELSERLEQLRALHAGIDIAVSLVPHAWGGVDSPQDLAALEQELAQTEVP